MLIDTHCHIEEKDYSNRDEVIKDIFNSGVSKIIISGYNIKTNEDAIKLANNYENVYVSVGIHPSEIDNIEEKDYIALEEQLKNPKVVALGEIGLDYYYHQNNKKKQKEAFIRQLDIAIKCNKPVVIHNRDAFDDIYQIIKDRKVKGAFHCFNGTLEMANKIINEGLLIGVNGIITFKKNDELREVIKGIPLEYIVLETDSPYLTPEPFRGKINNPKYILYTANQLANIKNISYNEVCDMTSQNAIHLFDL